MTLRLVHSRHDLPPRWDGEPVTWKTWREYNLSCFPDDDRACLQCGAIDSTLTAHGVIAPPPGATVQVLRDKRTKSGHTYEGHVSIPAWPTVELTAFRCKHCGHDYVLDRAGKTWDLDDTDYTDDGSYEPGQGTLI